MNTQTIALKRNDHKRNYLLHFLFLIALLFTFFSGNVFAGKEVNIDKDTGLAIYGYDPVAYFTQSKPVKGKAEFVTEYQGNKWAFSSAEHKELFTANPDKYLPEYGGYCAYAASIDRVVDIDPDAWTIHNDKLYLNFNDNVRSRWLKDVDDRIVTGDKNWPALLEGLK